MTITRTAMAMVVIFWAATAAAAEIRVAVASNFITTIRILGKRFEAKTGNRVRLVSGSTGKLYAQIRNGAPLTAFFAADARRPRMLEQEGVALAGSRFTYAFGRIILWSPTAGRVDHEGRVLNRGDFRYLSLANPKLAPYGRAAEQILRHRGLWQTLHGRMVRGENIGQAFQFVNSGNAELGFVALSQVISADGGIRGSFWKVPRTLYDPIEQQAVLLRDNRVARAFLSFVRSDTAMAIIKKSGYAIP